MDFALLRFHLGLRIPGPCRLRVGDETAAWTEGRALVFDDTHEHEAWNDSDGERGVLFVDFLRPLPEALEGENGAIVEAIARSPFIRDARRNAADWERELGERVDAQRLASRVDIRHPQP